MNRLVLRLILYLLFLVMMGCGADTGVSESSSANTALFDPGTGTVPLPNVLLTAAGSDPITQYRDPATGRVGMRPANSPMNPQEAINYVNVYEVGGSNAVSGVNAPIYIRFAAPLLPETVNGENIKVFQVGADSASPSATENNRLTFSDVTGMFDFRYSAGSSSVSLFPRFPLLPATRYLYLVTNRVKDAATGGSVSSSVYFQALKSTRPLGGPFAALEPIRANTVGTGGNILFSGYAKVMNDLISSYPTSTVQSRNDIVLLGRFITTAAGFVATDPSDPTRSSLPVETALRAFAAGSDLPGGLSGKSWLGAGLNTITVTTPSGLTPAGYWAEITGGTVPAPPTVGYLATGEIHSADISMNPVVAHDNPDMNLNVPFGTYSPATSVLQPFRDPVTHRLTGFYYTDRDIPFVYISPAGIAPAGGWPLVIFQHGINHRKEDVVAVAGSITAAGFAVVAIDLPLHGELAVTGHTSGANWGDDFMSVGAPLAARANIQQAAFNLDRLELTIVTPAFNPAFAGMGFAALGANAPNPAIKPRFVGMSLGSIVGAYYLAGNTTLNSTPGAPPYTQASLNRDMKGLLNTIGGRIAYLIKESADYGPIVSTGLAAKGIQPGTPTFDQFFLLTQAVLDPADPATMTTPLPNYQSPQPLPSRLSGRILVQEATTTRFDANGTALNGDLVIPNSSTRYFGNALGGRGVAGTRAAFTVAPGFDQVSYASRRVPELFMYTRSDGKIVPKVTPPATSASASGPREGYFQFDQPDVTHGFLIDLRSSPVSLRLAQRQMVYFIRNDLVVDPAMVSPALPKLSVGEGAGMPWRIELPPAMRIFGRPE